MFGLESKTQQRTIDQRIDDLDIEIEAMAEESREHFWELGISLEEIDVYINNPNHFSEETWELLQSNLSRLEEKLKRDLDNIRDPKATKASYKERQAPSHWIPMP